MDTIFKFIYDDINENDCIYINSKKAYLELLECKTSIKPQRRKYLLDLVYKNIFVTYLFVINCYHTEDELNTCIDLISSNSKVSSLLLQNNKELTLEHINELLNVILSDHNYCLKIVNDNIVDIDRKTIIYDLYKDIYFDPNSSIDYYFNNYILFLEMVEHEYFDILLKKIVESGKYDLCLTLKQVINNEEMIDKLDAILIFNTLN